MAEALSLRPAGAADAPAIARLVNDAYRPVESSFIRGERTDVPEIEVMQARGRFLLLERAGRLEGSVYVEDRGDHGYIGLVSVDPALQRAGIGRALVAAAEEWLIDLGRPRAELQVVNLRTELLPWYEKQGYREVATRPFPPDAPNTRPCHFVVMSKRLAKRRERQCVSALPALYIGAEDDAGRGGDSSCAR